ncbi:MAG: DNA repair protein RadA [Desulfurella sp.]|uniref:DNA repair protein RadA n=1 Tax=Desulfurella sp. TaxID=1962857 RepID=UPI003D14DBBC
MKEKTYYVCSNCGFKTTKWSGKCPNCGEWNTLKQEIQNKHKSHSLNIVKLDEIDLKETINYKTNYKQIDDFLGGGFVSGGVYLVAGSPGIGKSTLLLQLSKYLLENNHNVLYISAEESANQLSLKANRLNSKIQVLESNDLDEIVFALKQDYNIFIIDSIHTIYSSEVDSYVGSINQVRLCAQKLIETAKENNKTLIIVSHITKEGIIAGPKALEHLVDAVFYLESDEKFNHRLLRATKNRFASTEHVVIFQMTQNGLKIIEDEFLTYIEDATESEGKAIGAILEGSYLMFVEIQALCVRSPFGMPRRTSVGFDLNRLNMLLAVIEKRLGISSLEYDVYLNVIGGFKINNTLVDMAVAASIISSLKKIIIQKNYVFLGEIDLLGNIRKIKLPDVLRKKLNSSNIKLFLQENTPNVESLLKAILQGH